MVVDRFCPACGTEVDEDARFCPTCGQTLHEGETGSKPDLPAAPAWPEPEAVVADEQPTRPAIEAPLPVQAAAPSEPAAEAPVAAAADVTPATSPPASAAPPPVAPPPPAQPAAAHAPQATRPGELPFTTPSTLSGWLIGVGSAAGAIALIPRLNNLLSLLLFLALLGVTATVFLAERIPRVPRLRLIVLVVTLLGLGIALERSAFTVRGLDTLLLICMLVAAGGALLLELDRDRPVGPLGGSGG